MGVLPKKLEDLEPLRQQAGNPNWDPAEELQMWSPIREPTIEAGAHNEGLQIEQNKKSELPTLKAFEAFGYFGLLELC